MEKIHIPPAQTCRVGNLLGGRLHLGSHFHLAPSSSKAQVNPLLPLLMKSYILSAGLLLLQSLFPRPRWPEVCLQSRANFSLNWAASTPAWTSGAERISSSASRPGCAQEGFSLCLAVMLATSSGDSPFPKVSRASFLGRDLPISGSQAQIS